MTNETTASQPKSIGDDAQFCELLRDYMRAFNCDWTPTAEVDEKHQKLIAYIDSRAPAAQASATIQAAPLPAERTPNSSDPRDEAHASGWNACLAAIRSVATIQEPVMVAEPVGQAQPIAAGWTKFADQVPPEHTQIFWRHGKDAGTGYFMEEDKADWVGEWMFPFAAPMVADPAGVALATLKRYPDSAGPGRGEMFRVVDVEALFAATVKAVPSEALDTKRLDWLMANNSDYSVKIRGQEKYGWFIHDPWRDISSSYFSTSREAIDAAIAAPLADKTGGGE